MGMLDVEHLCVSFEDRDGNPLPAVTDVSFSMKEGSVTCLVGESGCGKSLTARACLRVLPPLTILRTRAFSPSFWQRLR